MASMCDKRVVNCKGRVLIRTCGFSQKLHKIWISTNLALYRGCTENCGHIKGAKDISVILVKIGHFNHS